MNKNTKLLYCLLGSAILALLNTPLLRNSFFGILENMQGVSAAVLYQIMYLLINLLSLAGGISLVVFSVLLIKRNVGKEKE